MSIIYGFFLLALALFKVIGHWRQHGFRGSRLVLVLIKDQVLYSIVLVLAISTFKTDVLMLSRAICVDAFGIAEDETLTSFVPSNIFAALGSPVLLCILGSHMFFNLKEAAEHGVNVGTNWSSYSHSVIRFDEPGGGEFRYVFLRASVIFILKLISARGQTRKAMSK